MLLFTHVCLRLFVVVRCSVVVALLLFCVVCIYGCYVVVAVVTLLRYGLLHVYVVCTYVVLPVGYLLFCFVVVYVTVAIRWLRCYCTLPFHVYVADVYVTFPFRCVHLVYLCVVPGYVDYPRCLRCTLVCLTFVVALLLRCLCYVRLLRFPFCVDCTLFVVRFDLRCVCVCIYVRLRFVYVVVGWCSFCC